MFAPALNSLIFDCEVALPTEDGAQTGPSDSKSDAYHVGQRLETLCRASCPFARELRCCIQRILLSNYDQDCQDVNWLAIALAGCGYLTSVRTALSGKSGVDCFKSLRHEFLVVRGTGEFRGMEFIVEPSLRQHFLIPHPSREYEYVLSRTPDVFVGGSCRLVPVVQLLCAVMADSFTRQGLPLPPWRREAAMLSKWLPQPHRCRDTPVLPPPAAAAAAAAATGTMFPPPRPSPYDPTAADLAALAATALSRGYIMPSPLLPPLPDPAGQSGLFFVGICAADSGVSRTDSDISTDSCDRFVGCAPFDNSPVSVLRLPPPPAAPAGGDTQAAVAVRKGPAVQRGFEPAPAAAGQEALASTAQWPQAAAAGECAPEGRRSGRERRRSGSSNRSVVVVGSGSSRAGSGVEGSAGGRASGGLLSAQMQLQEQQQQHRPASAAAGDSSGADAGSGDGSRIRTRPPVHRGEMAIRVVKLVGFAVADAAAQSDVGPLPPASAPAKAPPPPEQPRQHQKPPLPRPPPPQQQQQPSRAPDVLCFQTLAPSAASSSLAAGGGCVGVPWAGRDPSLHWKLRQRAA